MKGFLTALLVFASTGMVYAQQPQGDFSPRQPAQGDAFARRSASSSQAGFSSQSDSSPRTNQTRLAALQDGGRVGNESDKYVIMDDTLDFSRESDRQRPFFGPENNPRIRNAVQEQQRFTAQSSKRTATNVLPPRGNRGQNSNVQGIRNGSSQAPNVRYASNQAQPVSSIYDLQITPAYEDELKQRGYLFASLDTAQAKSDQMRLFGDSQRARSGSNESKIFSSQISTYRGNIVIDIDDYALQRIEEGSYTLDDFGRHDARGVLLRYVSASNDKVDLTRLDLGQSAGRSESPPDYARRSVADNRPPERRGADYRSRAGGGDWVLPTSGGRNPRDSRRDLEAGRTGDVRGGGERRDVRGRRGSLASRYDASPVRRDYQDRMADIYRDDTVRTRDRLVDRRVEDRRVEDRRYDDVTFSDRRAIAGPRRDVLDAGRRELDQGFAELSQWQRDLAKKTRAIEEERRQLGRLEVRAEAYPDRYETVRDQSRGYRPVDLDRLRGQRSPVVTDRYADSRNSSVDNHPLLPASGASLDPKFAPYAKNNLDQVARLNQKFAAIQQANELAALENQVDNEYQQQQLKHAQAKLKNGNRTVKTFIDDGEVRNTLGANMAASRGGGGRDRYAANLSMDYPANPRVADMSLRSGRPDFSSSAGQQAVTAGASNKLVRALWLIALLSIGMNMYLALLARSFYSRYNELADELRETFTASI